MLLQLVVVTLGTVVREKVHCNTDAEGDYSGNNRDPSPGDFGWIGLVLEDLLEKREKSRSHDQLGDTSSKVSPSTDKGIGGSDNLLGEHSGGPVLAHHKCTSGGSNKETENGKAGSARDKTGTGGRDGREAKDSSEKNTGSDFIAQWTKEEAHEDGPPNTDNTRGPKFLLGKSESNLDFGKKRGDGKPDEESNEETQPRKVEGSHVWAREVAKLDLGSFIILLRIDFKCVSIVLLPFGLSNEKRLNDDGDRFLLLLARMHRLLKAR